MDARDRLRRYLEQRRELGESEFVLDGLPVEDVLKLVGAKATATRALRHGGEGPARRETARAPETHLHQHTQMYRSVSSEINLQSGKSSS